MSLNETGHFDADRIGVRGVMNDGRRVDDAFHRLSDFNADIAHELRTPITNLMTQTQVALSRARGVEEYREILYSNMEEYERMAQMVGDMLFLAQADDGRAGVGVSVGVGTAIHAHAPPG